MNDFIEFPSPFEVTGVSNLVRLQPSEPVRVRFRTLARKLGVITIHWVALINYRKEFPSPLEETGVSYTSVKYPRDAVREFPSPSEVTGGLTEAEFKAMLIEYAFPSPLKVTGGSYRMRSLVSNNKLVSVPYRGNWGVLHMLLQLTKY